MDGFGARLDLLAWSWRMRGEVEKLSIYELRVVHKLNGVLKKYREAEDVREVAWLPRKEDH